MSWGYFNFGYEGSFQNYGFGTYASERAWFNYGYGSGYGYGGGYGVYNSLYGMSQSWYEPSWVRAGVTPGYRPYVPVGGRALGYGPTSWVEGGEGAYSRYSYTHTPIYEYEKGKAVDYKFQLGQRTHNVNVQTRVSRQTIRRDPVILDLNNDGKLDITKADHSIRNVNFRTSVSSRTRTRGSWWWRTRERITTTRREWDTLKDWNHKINYDVDGDGKVDRTQWLKKGARDGFLVYDANHDGKITGNELMNESSLSGKKGVYKNGWEKALAIGDRNHDGKLTGDELKGFAVWNDRSGDGITNKGELKSLDELGIIEINAKEGSFTRRKEVGYVDTFSGYHNYQSAYWC